MVQIQVALIIPVAEGHIVKDNRAVRNLGQSLLLVCQVTGLIQHLADTLCGGPCHGQHDGYHGDKHQTHQDIHRIGKEAHQLTGGHISCYDGFRSQPGYGDDTGIYRKLHRRHHGYHQLLGSDCTAVYRLGGLAEFLLFMLLADIGLDDADTGQVLLHGRIQDIVFVEHFPEIFSDAAHQKANDEP